MVGPSQCLVRTDANAGRVVLTSLYVFRRARAGPCEEAYHAAVDQNPTRLAWFVEVECEEIRTGTEER